VPVDQHPTALRVVEPRDQLGEGRLAGAGFPDERERLPRRHVDRHIAQRPGRVALLSVASLDLAARAFQTNRPVEPVREPDALHLDLPAQRSGILRVRLVDHVRLGVQQVEDLVERGHPLLVGRVEIGELLDRIEERGQIAHEGDHHPDLRVARRPGKVERLVAAV
jgi:hypothetical protein